jgi:hypothetical protein
VTDKTPKSEVDYGPGKPTAHCGPTMRWGGKGSCWKFEPPHACLRIAGRIEPEGWCKRWEAKSKMYSAS